MRAIYKFNCNCGSVGDLQGIFVAEKEHVAILIDRKIKVYFGEVLGKHSEIHGAIEPKDLGMVSDNSQHVKFFEELKLFSGYNPFHYRCSEANEYGLEGDDATVLEVVEFILSEQKK